MNLIKYDEACRAVADAKSVDEVREFLAGADAAKAYAKQAKNRQLELDAIEIRTRAERRLGEILIELQAQGHCRSGNPFQKERTEIITMRDLGIDGALSQVAQRLALVRIDRFESEVREWRDEAADRPHGRISAPLQYVRNPSGGAAHARAIVKSRKKTVSLTDGFSKYIAPDGRRMADWRIGELERLRGLFSRAADCAAAMARKLPVANADPLSTVENIFRVEELKAIFQEYYERTKIPKSDAGIVGPRIEAARNRRERICEGCSSNFVMKRTSGRAGRFCSRECAFEHQKEGGVVGLRELRCL